MEPDPEIMDIINGIADAAVARGFTFPDGSADVNRYIEHLAREAGEDPEDPEPEYWEDLAERIVADEGFRSRVEDAHALPAERFELDEEDDPDA